MMSLVWTRKAGRLGTCRLPSRVTRTLPGEPLDQTIEIGIAGAESPSEPVPPALGDSLPVRDHVELTGPARRRHGLNIEALLDEGHEPRGLGCVVLSRRAVDVLDL